MAPSSTLFRYLSRNFLINFAALISILIGIIFTFDVIELLRRASNRADVPFDVILTMSMMKLPYFAQILLPFAILFAAIYTCWKLNKMQEIVVIRSAGLSVWQFLSPMIVSSVLLGVLATTLVNPIASTFLSKYNQMEIVHFSKEDNLVTVSRTGIWLRQPTGAGYALIHAETLDQTEWRMTNVIVYFFDQNENFLKRLDCPLAYLKPGQWEFRDVLVNDRGGYDHEETVAVPTELTPNKIEDSFSDPDTISFWNIPEYISIMEETGVPTTRLHIYFQSLLARPFLFAAMVLLAATFSLRPTRFGGTGGLVVLGVTVGFVVFFLESMLNAFGFSMKIPAYLAAWSPATVSLLLGVNALLHLEDG